MKRILMVWFLLWSASTVCGFQSQLYLGEKGGFFRLDFSVDEFQGVTADSLIIVPDSDRIFGLYKIDTAQIASLESKTSENQWQYVNANRDVQKLRRWEGSLDQEAQKLIVRRQALESILDQEKRGEFALDPIERSNVESKVADLLKQQEPYARRIADVRKERNELEMKLVNQFSENRKKIFREKPDFSVLGRFSGDGLVKLRFNSARDGKTLLEVPLSLPDSGGGDDVLVQQWLKAQRDGLDQLDATTPGDSVFSYLRVQSPRRFLTDGKPDDGKREDVTPGRSGNPPPDLYSLVTGALAVQETLQLDRMTGSSDQTTPSIPIKRLTGPHLRSLPYAEMLENRTPKTLPIDDLVPVEFYSCHFSNVQEEIAFSDLLEQWGTSLYQTFHVSAHDAQAKEKYLQQWCLEMTDLARLFADQAIDDLTLCGADPFLHEGTDLSVIVAVKNRALFDLNASRYFAKAKTDFPGCREETFSYGDVSVHALTTPDRLLHSFSCDLGQYKVYSNSRRAIGLIIDTFQKKHASVGQAPDYRYMRTIYPFDPAKEDFFLFLSESHIRQLIGPVWKVARQRRLHCVNSLRILHNALSLFGAERASGTPTLERLIQGGFVEPAYLFCPDGGTYSLTGDLTPVCSHHGQLRYVVPILDESPTLVTETEWDQYQGFVKEYNSYWSRFFDPIGVRGTIPAAGTSGTASEGVSLETCIMPLIENSYYDSFKRFSAGTPVKMDLPTHPRTIVQFLAKVNLQDLRAWDPSVERFFFTLTQKTSLTGDELVDALGEALSINFLDADLKFQVELGNVGPLLLGFLGDSFKVMVGNLLLSGLSIPTYAVIAVRDEKKVERFVREELRSLAQESALANRNAAPTAGGGVLAYETFPRPGGPAIHTLDVPIFVLRLHFFFCVHDGHLIIANQRRILTDILDHPEVRTKAETNLAIRVLVKNFQEVSQTAQLYWQERMRAVCRNNLGSVDALRRYRGIPPEDWWNQSMRINGYAPFCPANGSYGVDAVRDTIRCSVHGDILSPCQPFEPDMSVPLNTFISTLKAVEADLSLTPEGIQTRIKLER